MERISQNQLIMLYILNIYGANVGFVLAGLSQATEYVGWLCLILGWIGALAFMYVALKLAATHPDVFITHFGGKLVSRPLHLLFMAMYLYYIMHIGASISRELCDFMIQTYLQITPDWAIASLFGLCVILAVRSGIETIFRCAQGFIFIVLGVVLLTPFLLTESYNWPIAGAFLHHWELQKIWAGSITSVTLYSDLTLIVFIYPHLRDKEKTFRSLALGSAGAMALTVMTYITCLLLFGVHFTAHATYPTLEMMRMIRVGDFLDNLDPFLIAIWMTTLFLKVSLYLYIVVAGIGQLLGLKHSKPLSFSIGAIMIGMSIHIASSIMEVQYFLRKVFPLLTYIVQSTLFLYWAGYWLQSRKLRKNQLQAKGSG